MLRLLDLKSLKGPSLLTCQLQQPPQCQKLQRLFSVTRWQIPQPSTIFLEFYQNEMFHKIYSCSRNTSINWWVDTAFFIACLVRKQYFLKINTEVFTDNCFLNDTINTAKSVLSGHPRKEILPLHEMHENIDLSIHWKEKHLQLGGILTRKGHPISTNRNIAEVEMNKITTKLQFCLHKFYLFVDIQQLELKKNQ